MKKGLWLTTILLFVPLMSFVHQDLASEGPVAPIAGWVLEGSRVEKGLVAPTAGTSPLTLSSSPQAEKVPLGALYFVGGLTGARLDPTKNKPTPAPRETITLLAWVRLDAGARKGGIIGRVEDNRYGVSGTYLGYDESHFVFGLTPGGPGIGEGRIQLIRSALPFKKGVWS